MTRLGYVPIHVCRHLLAVAKVSLQTSVPGPLSVLGCAPARGIARSYGNFIFNCFEELLSCFSQQLYQQWWG